MNWSDITPRQRRMALTAGFAVVVVLLLAWAFHPQPALVDLGAVRRGVLVVELPEEGKTRIREVYAVSAPVGGRLERVEARAGDPVIAGVTALARIRPAEPAFRDRRTTAELESVALASEAARDAAAADVRRARAEYEQAQAVFARESTLFESGTIARARFDTVRAARDSARAGWDGARNTARAREADLARARAALIDPAEAAAGGDDPDTCCIVMRAPVDGEVLTVIQESETVLLAGAQVLEIGDPRDLEIVAEFLSADAVRVEEGARVRIDGWGGGELVGRVRRVEPSAFTKISALGIEEQRVNIIIDIESPAEDWLRLAHRYRVDVHIEAWRGEDQVVAPSAALFRMGQDWATFVVVNGAAELRLIEVGQANAREAQVLSGLEPGDELVLHPTDRVADGVQVIRRTIENLGG